MSLKRNTPKEDMMNKTIAEFGYSKYLTSMITNNVRCRWEIKSNITMAKAAFKNKK